MSDLKNTITEQMKDAMRAKDKERLGTIRLMLAEIKRIEVDERIELDDARILIVLDKMVKQRRDSITQYEAAERPELAAKEQQELEVIKTFLPQPLSDAEITQIIDDAIATSGALSMQDMGKVMALIKPQVQGRADVGKISGLVKQKL
ncbi:GatB/YqeY domain-containing protein [Nitrincola sp.]|uniref:GatB/YqeY domain-containing protein n=1 Tax=Nitrincola sp. TaxID=1926584 RepID=UPI003A8F3329